MAYLHSQDIVHGDLKSVRHNSSPIVVLTFNKQDKQPNILISGDGNPLLCDFGLSALMSDMENRQISTTLSTAKSYQWAAVELLDTAMPASAMTLASDIWAFAMVSIEVGDLD